MKIVTLIARLLLGLMFVVFGSNGFLHFIPMGSLPPGPAGGFEGALMGTPYFYAVAAVMVVSGVLFLVNRFVPLGLTLLGPVLVNILLFHAFLLHQGFQAGVVATLLWFLFFYAHRRAFAGIFEAKV
jgi:hypothetical protein